MSEACESAVDKKALEPLALAMSEVTVREPVKFKQVMPSDGIT